MAEEIILKLSPIQAGIIKQMMQVDLNSMFPLITEEIDDSDEIWDMEESILQKLNQYPNYDELKKIVWQDSFVAKSDLIQYNDEIVGIHTYNEDVVEKAI